MSNHDILFDLDEVSFRYGADQILDSITLQIHRGDFLALLGPNGSGKSTLVKTMLGLTRPDHGSISIMGRDISEFTAWDRIG